MPIYAYRCGSCGFAKDVLQKLSDAPLTRCPECGDDAFHKQLTAAGFQLKGSGWYATDFRSGGAQKASSDAAAGADGAKDGAKDGTKEGGGAAASAEGSGAGAAAATGGCGTSCACH